MTSNTKPAGRYVRYAIFALVLVAVLAGIHLSVQGDLVGVIMALHGR